MKKLKIIGAALFVVIFLIFLLPRLTSQSKIKESSTIVEDLATNRITDRDVDVIKFMQERPGFGVGPEIHAITARIDITKIMVDLAASLGMDASRGHKYRNHPSTLIPKQMVEILLVDGSKYELYGYIHHNWVSEDYFYATLNTWPRIQTVNNSKKYSWCEFFGNGQSTEYESREFVRFLRKYNPFFPEELKRTKSSNKATSADPKKPRVLISNVNNRSE